MVLLYRKETDVVTVLGQKKVININYTLKLNHRFSY